MSFKTASENTSNKRKEFQNEWLDVMGTLDTEKDIKVITIQVGLSRTFLGNFYGLLNNELRIGPDFWYPHLLLNGFNSSLDYNGETEILMIESSVLERMLAIFKKQKIK